MDQTQLSNSLAEVSAVIFDLDGVIFDTEPLHYEAARAALLTEAGVELDREFYAQHGVSRHWREFYTECLETNDKAVTEDVLERVRSLKLARFAALRVDRIGTKRYVRDRSIRPCALRSRATART